MEKIALISLNKYNYNFKHDLLFTAIKFFDA